MVKVSKMFDCMRPDQSSRRQHNKFNPSGNVQRNQQLEFQTYKDQQSGAYFPYSSKSLLHPIQSVQPCSTKGTNGFLDDEDEPPLLEELGIDLNRILQKTLAVLNPFHRGQIDDANYLIQDSDLAGPVVFYLLFVTFLPLAGSKAHYNYVYGLAVISCILMYILLWLMSNTSNITLSSVASVLGYCLLPLVGLAGVSIFITLRGSIGLVLSMLAITWATLPASRLFSTMSGEEDQRLLIAFPCGLVYGVFTLIIVF